MGKSLHSISALFALALAFMLIFTFTFTPLFPPWMFDSSEPEPSDDGDECILLLRMRLEPLDSDPPARSLIGLAKPRRYGAARRPGGSPSDSHSRAHHYKDDITQLDRAHKQINRLERSNKLVSVFVCPTRERAKSRSDLNRSPSSHIIVLGFVIVRNRKSNSRFSREEASRREQVKVPIGRRSSSSRTSNSI